MKLQPSTQSLRNSQSGLASIVVTMIIMIILSLLVLAAASIARREQRQTFDRQLSTQAFYAAESGVNDVTNAIKNNTSLASNDYVDDCTAFSAAAGLGNGNLGNNVKYSCLLVDPTPTTWEGAVSDSSRIVSIRPRGGVGAVNSITIAWQDKEGESTFAACSAGVNNIPPSDSWPCNTPLFRFDLVPATNLTRDALNSAQMTGFLFPSSGGVSTASYAPGMIRERIICNSGTTPKYCKVTINNLGASAYYMRIKTVYRSADVTICANSVSTNCNDGIEIEGSQVVIDSTGRAADVLRRIQVRLPLTGITSLPEFAIESGDTICKLLSTGVADATTDPACPID